MFSDQDITSMLTDHQHDLCSRISKSIRIFCSNLVDFPFSRGCLEGSKKEIRFVYRVRPVANRRVSHLFSPFNWKKHSSLLPLTVGSIRVEQEVGRSDPKGPSWPFPIQV